VKAGLGPRRTPVVVINKFKPTNVTNLPKQNIVVKPNIKNYTTLPEQPSIIFKPTVRAPKVTVRPTIRNFVETPALPPITVKPVVRPPKVVNHITNITQNGPKRTPRSRSYYGRAFEDWRQSGPRPTLRQ